MNPNTPAEMHGVITLQGGGRCLINCVGGTKIYMHNAVVAALTKRINGKGFVATQREAVIHQTVRKQADITVIRQADIDKPSYVDVTVAIWILVKIWKENSFHGTTSLGKVPAVS